MSRYRSLSFLNILAMLVVRILAIFYRCGKAQHRTVHLNFLQCKKNPLEMLINMSRLADLVLGGNEFGPIAISLQL
jgi:hypothetical protein